MLKTSVEAILAVVKDKRMQYECKGEGGETAMSAGAIKECWLEQRSRRLKKKRKRRDTEEV